MTLNCIPQDVLLALQAGGISDAEASAWEEHLLDCPDCLVRTRTIRNQDTLVAALNAGRGATLSTSESVVVQQLMQRLADRSQLESEVAEPSVAAEESTLHSQAKSVTDAPETRGLPAASLLSAGTQLGPYRIHEKL